MRERTITASMVKELRDITCVSITECHDALKKCNGDMLLSQGYLKYNGCAIHISGGKENYDKWVMNMAQEWKEKLQKEKL